MKDVTIILDRSGSMNHLKNSVVEHFNNFLGEYKATGEKSSFSLVQFDHEIEKLIDNKPIQKVKPLTLSDFNPRGTTSLNDAIGITVQEKLKSFSKKTKVVIAIITDGLENSSIEYTTEMVKRVINHGRAKGWNILFFGANQDSILEGSKLGIGQDKSYDIDFSGLGVKFSLKKIYDELAD